MKYSLSCAIWETTLKCNLKCSHCGSAAGNPRPNELTTEEALKLVEDLAELKTQDVCLMGGEPFDSDTELLQELVDILRWRLNKKVCIFTSYSAPWLYTDADHYHIHLNVAIPYTDKPDNVSYGYVSYGLTELDMSIKLNHVSRDVPIYVKTCLGYEEYSNADTNAMYISSVLGFNNIQVDGIINVD